MWRIEFSAEQYCTRVEFGAGTWVYWGSGAGSGGGDAGGSGSGGGGSQPPYVPPPPPPVDSAAACWVMDHLNDPYECLEALKPIELAFLTELGATYLRDSSVISDTVARADCTQAAAWLAQVFDSPDTLVYKGKYDYGEGDPPLEGGHIATTVQLSDGRRVIHVDPWVFRYVGTDVARAAVLRAMLHEAVHVMAPSIRHDGHTPNNPEYIGIPVFSSIESRSEAKSCVAPFVPLVN